MKRSYIFVKNFNHKKVLKWVLQIAFSKDGQKSISHSICSSRPFCSPIKRQSLIPSLESRWACDLLITNRMWQKRHCVASGVRSKTLLPSQHSAAMRWGSQGYVERLYAGLLVNGPHLPALQPEVRRESESSDILSPAINSLPYQASSLPSWRPWPGWA